MPALDLRILREPLGSRAWSSPASPPGWDDEATRDPAIAAPVESPALAPGALDRHDALGTISPIVSPGASAIDPTTNTDDLAGLLDTSNEHAPILRARCDDIARRIVGAGGQITTTELARQIGCAPATIKRLMSRPIFRDVFNAVNDEIMGTIDDRILDERLDLTQRQVAQQQRAMTMLAKCFAIVDKHAAQVMDGTAVVRPGVIKLAIEAAAEVRQIGQARGGAANGVTINNNISLTRNQSTIIQGAIRESGIDLSDVLGEMTILPTESIEKAS